MQKIIKTFDNKEWDYKNIVSKMYDDDFYYDYLGKNALSSSEFKNVLNGTYGDENNIPKQALRDGRLIHLAVLEPHRLDDLIIIDSTKGSKAFKEAVIEYNDAMVYTTRELKKCTELASNVKVDFDSFLLLDDSDIELPSIKMIDGLPVRAKADAIKGKHIIDLKTTSDASRFEQSIEMFSYDLQGALYLDIFGGNIFSFIILDKITGEVSIRQLTETEIESGKSKLKKAIEIYKNVYAKGLFKD